MRQLSGQNIIRLTKFFETEYFTFKNWRYYFFKELSSNSRPVELKIARVHVNEV